MVDRVPLRVKLVAAILVLVLAGLMVIGAVSVFALRSYLMDGVDQQLLTAARNANAQVLGDLRGELRLPLDFIQQTSVHGVGDKPHYDPWLTEGDLPPLVTGLDQIQAVALHPYSVSSVNHRVHWRMLVAILDNGGIVHFGINLSTVERTVSKLVFVELLVGSGALVLLAMMGVAMVRASLRPLREIERTAGAIGGYRTSKAVTAVRRAPNWAGSAAPSTRCSARSRPGSPRARSPRRGRGARRSGCASSSRTPHTSCAPR